MDDPHRVDVVVLPQVGAEDAETGNDGGGRGTLPTRPRGGGAREFGERKAYGGGGDGGGGGR